MFYFNELFFRIKILGFSYLLLLILCYIYRDILLVIFSFSLLKFSLASSIEFSDFIYTHPVELFKVHFFFGLLLSAFFIMPLGFWSVLDFLKSSLTKNNYKLYCKKIATTIFLIFFVNVISFYYLLPNLWFFFQNFNTLGGPAKMLKFFFELRIEEYFYFVVDFLYLTNIFIFVLFFLYFLINSFGVSNILYWKKLFVFINIVCATLLSPPDVYSQIIILFFLSFIFESLIFINLYFLNLDIGYEKLIRQHIKRN